MILDEHDGYPYAFDVGPEVQIQDTMLPPTEVPVAVDVQPIGDLFPQTWMPPQPPAPVPQGLPPVTVLGRQNWMPLLLIVGAIVLLSGRRRGR